MTFWRTILDIVRRWYVGPPLLALALSLGAIAYVLMPTHYVSSTTLALTTPAAGGTVPLDPDEPSGKSNPLLSFNEGLRTAATITIHALNTREAMKELGAGRGSDTTLIIGDANSNPALLGSYGPFVYIEADSTTAAAARAVVLRAREAVRAELVKRQRTLDAPPSTYIQVAEVVAPTQPKAQRAAKWKIAAAAVMLVVGMGLGVAYGAVRWRERRMLGPGYPNVPDARPDEIYLAPTEAVERPARFR